MLMLAGDSLPLLLRSADLDHVWLRYFGRSSDPNTLRRHNLGLLFVGLRVGGRNL